MKDVIWWRRKYAEQVGAVQCECGDIDASVVQDAIKRSKVTSAPGPDSWRNSELRALPPIAVRQLAELLNGFEALEVWPDALTSSWVAMLAKSPQVKDAGKVRPIVLHSTVYRLWSSIRYGMLREWSSQVFDDQFHAYLPHRDAKTA
eukprot:6100576-Amphidinium_carterae.1